MADCVDPDQIVHFRSYAIWVRVVCLRVQVDMLSTWSNQRLVEGTETAYKTTGWMAKCVNPVQTVHVRSYVFRICFVCSCQHAHSTHVVKSAFSRKQRIKYLPPMLQFIEYINTVEICRLHDILAV